MSNQTRIIDFARARARAGEEDLTRRLLRKMEEAVDRMTAMADQIANRDQRVTELEVEAIALRSAVDILDARVDALENPP